MLRDAARVQRYTFPLGQRDNSNGLSLNEAAIVPPGAAKMRITMTWAYDTPSTADQEHDLVWRVGNQPPRKTQLEEFKTATPISSATGKKVWEITLEPQWTDAFYQKKSNWLFVPYLKPYSRNDELYPDPRARAVTLEVVVFKDPAYASS